jgi:hypothetical protein
LGLHTAGVVCEEETDVVVLDVVVVNVGAGVESVVVVEVDVAESVVVVDVAESVVVVNVTVSIVVVVVDVAVDVSTVVMVVSTLLEEDVGSIIAELIEEHWSFSLLLAQYCKTQLILTELQPNGAVEVN